MKDVQLVLCRLGQCIWTDSTCRGVCGTRGIHTTYTSRPIYPSPVVGLNRAVLSWNYGGEVTTSKYLEVSTKHKVGLQRLPNNGGGGEKGTFQVGWAR